MQVPLKLVARLQKYYDPAIPFERQGLPDADLDGELRFYMKGGWQDEPWEIHIGALDGGKYDVVFWTETDTVFDSSAVFGDDEESAQRLLRWIEAESVEF